LEGKYCSICSNKKAGIKRLGDKNSSWIEDRNLIESKYTYKFYSKVYRQRILNEQYNLCFICKKSLKNIKGCSFHHIDYDKLNDNRENLCGLHNSCHVKTNFNRDIWRIKLMNENRKIVDKNNLFLTVYLAGYSKEYSYRNYVENKYSDKINILNPMSITHEQVIEKIGINEYSSFIVRRDKKMILSSDILIAYIGEHGSSFGTTMEIIYAYENGVPVYVIDDTQGMKNWNDAWVKFHTKKVFGNIDKCFNFILSIND
jgi:nucleoside 2-deoxyribosyltransferase